jgi:hypothetical protein
MSDDRRAEIEAVADILAWEYGLSERPSRRILEAAAKCIAALDRVRDARGDDEPSYHVWLCPRHGITTSDHPKIRVDGTPTAFSVAPCPDCRRATLVERAAQSPQDEDHDPDERALDTPLGARQRAQTQRDIADMLQFGEPQGEDRERDNRQDWGTRPEDWCGQPVPQSEGHGVLQEDNDTGVLGEPQGEDRISDEDAAALDALADHPKPGKIGAARSPQDEDHETAFRFQLPSPSLEDHEAGIDAAMRVFGFNTTNTRDESLLRQAIAAYLARVAPARPEQPPPDSLGGQPPAEPPEAP